MGLSVTGASWDTISIHAPHTRGDTVAKYLAYVLRHISIHAPHTRGDQRFGFDVPRLDISIHAPHTRGDQVEYNVGSTPRNFNPRPSYEGRLHADDAALGVNGISIHAPHTRGDRCTLHNFYTPHAFQSTPLIRGATCHRNQSI